MKYAMIVHLFYDFDICSFFINFAKLDKLNLGKNQKLKERHYILEATMLYLT
jgi:hypothetical protein